MGTRVLLRRHFWVAIVVSIVAVGSVGAVESALAAAREDGQKSRANFGASSAAIASTLELDLQHEQDLDFGAGAFIAANPSASQAEFTEWTGAVRAFDRYPELEGIAEVAMVQGVPPGTRPYDCLATVTKARTTQTIAPAGIGYCETFLGPALL